MVPEDLGEVVFGKGSSWEFLYVVTLYWYSTEGAAKRTDQVNTNSSPGEFRDRDRTGSTWGR
eukprot:2913232-Rhodomonas_salina.1